MPVRFGANVVSGVYSNTTNVPHEFLDHTGIVSHDSSRFRLIPFRFARAARSAPCPDNAA
jgi:hypothetical protein